MDERPSPPAPRPPAPHAQVPDFAVADAAAPWLDNAVSSMSLACFALPAEVALVTFR
jgi:hypothetical protein